MVGQLTSQRGEQVCHTHPKEGYYKFILTSIYTSISVIHLYMHTYINTYIYVYDYLCKYVYVCL